MLELWVIFSLGSALLFAISNILSKIVLSKEFGDPLWATVSAGFTAFLVFGIASFFEGPFIMNIGFLAVSLTVLSSFSSLIALYFYYRAIKLGDVSRVVALLSLIPLFVLIMAFLFLGERLELLHYVGIGTIICGAFLISFNKRVLSEKRRILVTWLAVISVVFFAVRNIFNKFVLLEGIEIWSILFWFAIGSLIASIFLVIRHHPHLKKKAKKGLKHFFFINLLSNLGRVLLVFGFALGSVSLVTALGQITPFIVFIFALILSKWHPHLLEEHLSKEIIIRRGIAILLIIVGSILIV